MFKFNAFAAVVALGTFILPVIGQAQTQAQPTFSSVSIELPMGDRNFPGGAQAEVVNNNCLGCHSAGMVLTQPSLSQATWDTEVHKMINVYKAPVTQEDVPAIIAYLSATKSTK